MIVAAARSALKHKHNAQLKGVGVKGGVRYEAAELTQSYQLTHSQQLSPRFILTRLGVPSQSDRDQTGRLPEHVSIRPSGRGPRHTCHHISTDALI